MLLHLQKIGYGIEYWGIWASQINKSSRLKAVRDLHNITLPESTICKSCQFGKKTRVKFNAKEGSASKPLELIHTDICGPMRKRSPRGEKYYILFIDDFSRMCWIGLLKHKDEAFEKFQIFKALEIGRASCRERVSSPV